MLADQLFNVVWICSAEDLMVDSTEMLRVHTEKQEVRELFL